MIAATLAMRALASLMRLVDQVSDRRCGCDASCWEDGVFMKTSFKRLGAFDLEPDQYGRRWTNINLDELD